VPDVPCAAPFAAEIPGDIHLCVPAQTPPLLGYGPLRLLVRCKGNFIADKELHCTTSSSGGKCWKVIPPLCFGLGYLQAGDLTNASFICLADEFVDKPMFPLTWHFHKSESSVCMLQISVTLDKIIVAAILLAIAAVHRSYCTYAADEGECG